jgi:16S rRNA (adenine1518-N6/adenine1519-N6)-dimethyltransferase
MQKYGQHFLVNKGVINKITDCVVNNMQGDIVEIGPGKGALTLAMLERGLNNLTLIEIDPKMVSWLKETLPSYARVNIIESDFLKIDEGVLPAGGVTFVGNLPYIDAAEILLKTLNYPSFKAAVFMFQREQALRLIAKPESKQYGALSVLFQAFAKARQVARVSPGSFNPPPKVDGEVLFITPLEQNPFRNDKHKQNFKELVKSAFAYRRKTVLNALWEVHGKNKDGLIRILNKTGIKVSARAGELPAVKYIRLAENLEGYIF